MRAGEISAIYRGTAKEETPIAMPRKNLARRRIRSSGAMPDQTAPIENTSAAARMTFFRPIKSATLPTDNAPITAPSNPAVVINSTQSFPSRNRC